MNQSGSLPKTRVHAFATTRPKPRAAARPHERSRHESVPTHDHTASTSGGGDRGASKCLGAVAILACTVAALLAGCGSPASNTADTRTIGVCMSTSTSPYSGAMQRELKRLAGERKINLILLDSQLDIQTEARNIESLVARDVDAICVNAVDAIGSRAALRSAAESDVPVICSNSNVEKPEELGLRAYTGSDYYAQAVVAARQAIQRKPRGNIVMITGSPGYSAAVEREQGFRDTLTAEGQGMAVLDAQPGNWIREDAQRVMSDFITKYGAAIDVVYSQDDNMTAGAVNALKASGYTLETKPVVVSIGAMADGLTLIKDGWIDASVMQSPKEDARLALDTALAIADGKQAEPFKTYHMETPPVDADNVDDVIDMHLWD